MWYDSLMQIHASCVARGGWGVLLLGEPGVGKSSLALRLIARGFVLVADDRVDLRDRIASPPDVLAGLIEVRGVGLVRLPHEAPRPVALAVSLGRTAERLPQARRVHAPTGVAQIMLEGGDPALAEKVAVALDCALGHVACVAGAFEAR